MGLRFDWHPILKTNYLDNLSSRLIPLVLDLSVIKTFGTPEPIISWRIWLISV